MRSKVAFLAVVVLAGILALYSFIVLFGTWFIVPKNPAASNSSDLAMRIGMSVGAILAFGGSIWLGRWARKKANSLD